MVVEDEDNVRKTVRMALERYGYTVLEAESAQKALEICSQYEGPIHLVLTDVVMPGMSGPELASRLEELVPQTKILLMSGYTDNALVHHGVLPISVNFISKPFSSEGLVRQIRKILDRESSEEHE